MKENTQINKDKIILQIGQPKMQEEKIIIQVKIYHKIKNNFNQTRIKKEITLCYHNKRAKQMHII